jgi:S1-C subfamily serine protease
MKRIIYYVLFLTVGFALGGVYFGGKTRVKTVYASTASTAPPISGSINEESAVTDAVKNSLPSVVTVAVVNTDSQIPNPSLNPYQPQPGGNQSGPNQNIGSGFVIRPDGLIITNKHVVEDTSLNYSVITNDNKTYPVVKIYRDPLNDMALLKINASGLKPLNLGDSDNLQLGQTVIAIGTQLGEFPNTVTVGVISGLGRGIVAGSSAFSGEVERLDNVIQTDAPVNPGNSGGPLLDSGGAVIGVNTAISDQGQNIGFAVPSSVVQNLLTQFQKNGNSFSQGFFGVRYQMISQSQAILNDVPQGAFVVDVVTGSPADQAGIQTGDIITQFDNQKITGNDNQLSVLIVQKKSGDTVNVTVWRNNQTFTKHVKLTSS